MRTTTVYQLLLIVALPILNACGSNEEKTTTTNDSSATTTTAPVSTASTEPFDMMLVRHKVSKFPAFQASFDQHDSMRLANGIHAYAVGRGLEDTNMVLVALNVDDMTKARAFAKDVSLKQAMQKAGVVGKPEFMFIHMMFRDTVNNPSLTRAIINFKVKDWATWQTSFDSNRKLRLDNGLADRVYGHDIDDNHKVTIVLGINDRAKADAFWNSDLVKQKREESGLVGQPDKFIYTVVKRY